MTWRSTNSATHYAAARLPGGTAALQSELRHPSRKLWVHTAHTIVLNREVSAREGLTVEQV